MQLTTSSRVDWQCNCGPCATTTAPSKVRLKWDEMRWTGSASRTPQEHSHPPTTRNSISPTIHFAVLRDRSVRLGLVVRLPAMERCAKAAFLRRMSACVGWVLAEVATLLAIVVACRCCTGRPALLTLPGQSDLVETVGRHVVKWPQRAAGRVPTQLTPSFRLAHFIDARWARCAGSWRASPPIHHSPLFAVSMWRKCHVTSTETARGGAWRRGGGRFYVR